MSLIFDFFSGNLFLKRFLIFFSLCIVINLIALAVSITLPPPIAIMLLNFLFFIFFLICSKLIILGFDFTLLIQIKSIVFKNFNCVSL